MTRREAVQKVADFDMRIYPQLSGKLGHPELFVASLEALGLIKFEEEAPPAGLRERVQRELDRVSTDFAKIRAMIDEVAAPPSADQVRSIIAAGLDKGSYEFADSLLAILAANGFKVVRT